MFAFMLRKAGMTNSEAAFITNIPTPSLCKFFAAILARNKKGHN